MFKKPFKLKSQIQLKSSEKKKLGSELKKCFPALTDEEISSISNSKENINRLKLTTFKEEFVEVILFDKVPFFFEIADTNVLIPTVFFVWKFPRAVPHFTTNNFVFEKIRNGADLFFPGVMIEGIIFSETDFKRNSSAAVNLINNAAALAVGTSLLSKEEILSSKQSGKAVTVLHYVGDHLYKLHPDPTVLKLGAPDWVLKLEKEPTPDTSENGTEAVAEGEENPKIAKEGVAPHEEDTLSPISEEVKENSVDVHKEELEPAHSTNNEPEKDEKEKMNELLEYCFLKALKAAPKSIYPILPATFYANHVLAGLPNGETLNIKKTKWKKFSAYLQEKSLEGIIKLQLMQKNEYSIAGVNSSHRSVQSFIDPYNTQPITIEPKKGTDDKPVVLQVYSVSASTLPFFSQFGLKKHDELTRNDVRAHLNDYIKRENLSHPTMMEKVVLDPILSDVIKNEEVLSRVQILTKILEKMSVQHKVSNCGSGDVIVHKGKMPLVEFEVVMRTGNKKVTLISNLECYGVNVASFTKELQQKAAASTTTTPSVPGKKGPQVQVQGNQILVALSILKEKHNINEKFMKGLDKAPKSKKK